MPVLAGIAKDFKKRKLFKKLPLAHVHVTAETANLMIALKESGANVVLCASIHFLTSDDGRLHL